MKVEHMRTWGRMAALAALFSAGAAVNCATSHATPSGSQEGSSAVIASPQKQGVPPGKKPPVDPLAAKREMVRKQQSQRVTDAQRKAAAQALKAERLKIQQARQAAGLSSPPTGDSK